MRSRRSEAIVKWRVRGKRAERLRDDVWTSDQMKGYASIQLRVVRVNDGVHRRPERLHVGHFGGMRVNRSQMILNHHTSPTAAKRSYSTSLGEGPTSKGLPPWKTSTSNAVRQSLGPRGEIGGDSSSSWPNIRSELQLKDCTGQRYARCPLVTALPYHRRFLMERRRSLLAIEVQRVRVIRVATNAFETFFEQRRLGGSQRA
jgi:hypothetical protein